MGWVLANFMISAPLSSTQLQFNINLNSNEANWKNVKTWFSAGPALISELGLF